MSQRDAAPSLTLREREVLAGYAEGHSAEALARRLAISVNTVGFHTKNLYAKLGASNRAQVIVQATRLGLLGLLLAAPLSPITGGIPSSRQPLPELVAHKSPDKA